MDEWESDWLYGQCGVEWLNECGCVTVVEGVPISSRLLHAQSELWSRIKYPDSYNCFHTISCTVFAASGFEAEIAANSNLRHTQ